MSPIAHPRGPASERVLEPLRRVLAWQVALCDAQGRVWCPEHQVEHTGKSAYTALLAALLMHLERPGADREALFATALQQGRRLVANLAREDGPHECFTFRPGRHDPFNCSNSVIDGGACSDALASLVVLLGERLAAKDREAFAEASKLHARSYLRYAVLDKGIPAQRAWALTGIAAAHALEADPELERAALEGLGLLERIQNPDGSFPYHPLQWGAAHPGAADVSSFYQSRVTGFCLHALETLGLDPRQSTYSAPLLRGLEFLLALQGPHGIKCGLVEAKPWYWGAPYEVASHAFDVHTFARGFELFGDPRYAWAAARAFRSWVLHIDPSGLIHSHHDGPGRGRSYQCPVFWAAHAAWIARAAGALDQALELPEAPPLGARRSLVQWFESAQLARLEDEQVVAWVRGSRVAFNVHHGSPQGAGLLQVVRKRDGVELLERCRLGGSQEAEWSGLCGLGSPLRGWRSGAAELRFSLWLARAAWRAGRRGEAWRLPLRLFERGVLAFASPRVSSPFARQVELTILPDGVRVRAPLAWRDGTALFGSLLERSYRLDSGLAVVDRLLESGGARKLAYRLPQTAKEASLTADEARYRLE